jgi:murein DD-endopeptidase MepM/ murein hydrolase activator NlpD
VKLYAPLYGDWIVSSSFQDHLDRNPPSSLPGTDLTGKDIYGVSAYSIAPGLVEVAQGKGGGGLYVWMNHGRDEAGLVVKSYQCHFSSLNVVKGDRIPARWKIGEVGSTGRSTGSHLHIFIKVGGVPIDPMTVLSFP